MKKNYEAWKVKEKDFPVSGSIEEKIVFFVRYGILAPSTHNIQPWKFEIAGSALRIFPDWRYQLPQSDPTKRGLFVSLGACTTNIVVAAEYFNYTAKVTYIGEKEEDFFIQIEFKEAKKRSKEIAALFPSIVKRFSNKLEYSPKKIDKMILASLQNSHIGKATIKIIADETLIHTIASIHKDAVFALMKPNIFRAEIAKWLRENNTDKYDGMPGFVVGMPQLLSVIAKNVFAVLPIFPKKLAEKDYELLKSSPAIGIIATKDNDLASFVDVGRAYEILALKACADGIHTTPMAAMIENKQCTPVLAKAFIIKDKKLQFFFRLGYSDSKPYHTPRIPLDQVLI